MIGELIVKTAQKELGVTENPPNSNQTKYGTWFGFNGVAWCGIFCSWVYATAGRNLEGYGYSKGFAGCQTLYVEALKRKEITTDPKPGDLVLFDWNEDKRFDHVGIFVKWVDEIKGIFETIEGNTSINNDSNGGNVMTRRRKKSVSVFIHPKVLDK